MCCRALVEKGPTEFKTDFYNRIEYNQRKHRMVMMTWFKHSFNALISITLSS